MHRTRCMNCGGSDLTEFIDLGEQPNGNNFVSPSEKDEEVRFPIAMLVCETCWQVQIGEFPSQEFLFTNHPYITGANVPIVEHFERLSARIIERLALAPQSLVVDIGANDGTLLRAFARRGMRTLGVDPGQRTGELARQAGSTVMRTFWNRESGRAMRQLGLYPELITATAVFYHLPNLHDFIEGLLEVMRGDAVFVVQCVNTLDLIEKNQFDHFYHEHSCIHAIAPLDRLFRAHGMRILDAEFIDIHGGSFVAGVGLDSHSEPTRPAVSAAIARERERGLADVATYHEFTRRVRRNADELVGLLTDLRAQGKRVFALGAPVKGNTLLNYCRIGPELVECATEVNQFKIGTLTPGMHIPVVDERTIARQPDYYLILSWNFLDFLVGKYKSFLLGGGKFIVPVPTVRVLGFDAISH
ncbi:MAG TPA: class I SAM-dependent methyltransferase [Myxococcota bacterium]|nr:class I SAM-dependent methyltransferase [Myxococcota bacterium]